MNLLLDTHILICALTNHPSLKGDAREAIEDGNHRVFVSAVTAWEITTKKALGKIEAPENYEEELRQHRFIGLDITTCHALAVGKLPRFHEDPFDRLIIAQAQEEGLTLVTADKRILQYDISLLPA